MFGLFKKSRFKKEIEEALAGDILTEEKLSYLKNRAKELGMDQDFLIKQRQDAFKQKAEPIISRISATRRFSPSDEEILTKMARNFHVTVSFENEYNQFRMLWNYESAGDMPLTAIHVPITLSKGEQCYFQTISNWKQLKTIREKRGYSGIGFSFRVAKGVRLYSGRTIPIYKEYESLVLISSGDLYITDKRLVFNGSKRSTNTSYNKVIDIKEFQGGIEIFKNTGKPDYFQMTRADAEIASITIRKLLSE